MAVDRGLALHKMIRLLVLGLGGQRSGAAGAERGHVAMVSREFGEYLGGV